MILNNYDFMKKIFLWAFLPLLLIACDKNEILTTSAIPNEIASYVETHFPDNEILQAVMQVDGLELTYDVTLRGNIYLEFNRKKDIIEIKSFEKLPDSVIPVAILNYVSSNYEGNFIKEWEIDDRIQQVKLDNELELEFNKKGEFLRIDN